MKLMTMAVAVTATMLVAHSAQARVYHHRHYHHHYSRVARRHEFRREERRYAFRHEERHYAYRHEEERYAYRHEQERHAFRHERWARWDDRGWRSERHDRPTERVSMGGYGPRPREWCGWEMRHLVGGDPGPSYNLARNWAHWGHAGPAGVGAIVVWPHHVGRIVGRDGREWVVESGNDGNRLRTRPRSIAGVIAIRWG